MKKSLFYFILVGCSAAFSFLLGEANYLFFSPEMIQNHISLYSQEEKDAIEKDLAIVKSITFSEENAKTGKKPIYLATAGGPGARKTTILEHFLAKSQVPFIYLDPDQRALKFMAHTYYARSLCAKSVAKFEQYGVAVQKAYEKWRGASNYITLKLLEEAFSEKRNIAHGTTSTGNHIPQFLTRVHEAGYEIVLLLCSCEDSLRQKAVHYRNEEQKFYQSTPEDAVAKGKAFPQRMVTYFTFADTLYLYWSDDLFDEEKLAAIASNGTLQVLDKESFTKFTEKFERDRQKLQKEGVYNPIPSWQEILDLYYSRF